MTAEDAFRLEKFDLKSWEAKQARELAEEKALSAKNLRLFAERLRWPAGVVEQCEKLESEFPLFQISYWHEDVAWSKKGWYATPWRNRREMPSLFAETAEALRDAVRDVRPIEDAWAQ